MYKYHIHIYKGIRAKMTFVFQQSGSEFYDWMFYYISKYNFHFGAEIKTIAYKGLIVLTL